MLLQELKNDRAVMMNKKVTNCIFKIV